MFERLKPELHYIKKKIFFKYSAYKLTKVIKVQNQDTIKTTHTKKRKQINEIILRRNDKILFSFSHKLFPRKPYTRFLR